jgi:hypothetical protein
MGRVLYKLRHWVRPGDDPLFAATAAGDAPAALALLGTMGSAGVDRRDFRGFTGFLLACEAGSVELAEAMVSASVFPHATAAVDAADAEAAHVSLAGESALLVASERGYLPVVEWLLAGGGGSTAADVDFATHAEVPPAAVAASAAVLDRPDSVATSEAARVSWQAQRSWAAEGAPALLTDRPPSAAATVGTQFSRKEKLLDSRERGGQTPLHRAVVHGHVAVVGALLDAGSDRSHPDAAGFTPLHALAAAAGLSSGDGGRWAAEIGQQLLGPEVDGERRWAALLRARVEGRTALDILARAVATRIQGEIDRGKTAELPKGGLADMLAAAGCAFGGGRPRSPHGPRIRSLSSSCAGPPVRGIS